MRIQLLIPGVIATEFHDVDDDSLAVFPPDRVVSADELVIVSLRALELAEPVRIPSLPDIRDWDTYATVEQAMIPFVSRDRTAARYHNG